MVLLATDYADDIEHEINQLLGMQVSIEKLDADIYWLSPRLKLLNVNFYDNNGQHFLYSKEINLSLNWWASFKLLRPELGVISFNGTELNIVRQKNGDITVQGFPLKSSNSDAGIPLKAQSFLSHSSIHINNSRLQWQDLNNKASLTLSAVELAMVNDNTDHYLSISFNLPKDYGKRLTLSANLQGHLTQPQSLSGRIYGHLENINMQPWFEDYGAIKGLTASGRLSGEAWLDFDASRISYLVGNINSQSPRLDIVQADDTHQLDLNELSSRFKWQQKDDGWQLQLSDVQIKHKGREWPEHSEINAVYQQSQQQLQLQSNFIRSEDILALAQFGSHYIKPYMQQPLSIIEAYQLKGDFTNLSLFMPIAQADKFLFSSYVYNLSFYEPQQKISGSGFDGEIRARIDAAQLNLATQQASVYIAPLFRNEIPIKKLSGEIYAHKHKGEWWIQSDRLLLNNEHIKSQNRFKLKLDKENNIHSDLYSAFNDGDASQLKQYFPASIMDDELVDWLDSSILKGRISQGEFILFGELNAFPFENNEGVLEAIFDVENTRIKYLPNWPQIDDINARLRFDQNGMQISRMQGDIGAASIVNANIKIADFNNALLTIKGNTQGDAREYINFIKHSELNNDLSYISQFETSGPVLLDLAIDVPLDTDEETRVSGKLKLKENTLYIPTEKFRFENIKGELNFTESSVIAKTLSATLDAYPLDIVINNIVQDAKHYTHITSVFKAPAKSVLSTVPDLQSYFSGTSLWDVDIKIPQSEESDLVNVRVKSNLQGVSSSLSAPFEKKMADTKPLIFDLSVNHDDQILIDLNLAGDTKLEAHLIDDNWNVLINSNNIKGRAIFSDDFEKDVIARVELSYLDISPYFEGENSAVDIKPMNIPALDVDIKKFIVNDMKFSDVKLKTSRNKNGMYIQQLSAKAKGMNIAAKGSWMSGWRQQHNTQLNVRLNFNDLGAALKNLSISKAIHKGKGKAEVDWRWSAAPYDFDWKLVKGKGTFNIKDGRFNDINAGAGRLLGVLNFKTLLLLDFGNQVANGFPFDKAVGNMSFANGNAQMSKLSISSTVADIDISGRIGLSDEDLDQVFKVTPGVGSSLTMIGAVAGGPVTAVWVHLIQKLFSVDEIAAYTYTVKGSWDDPQVKLISAPDQNDEIEQELRDE